MTVLITAGPTREFIDPVRYLSNPATGRLGYLIARRALRKGHRVILVSGPTCLKVPKGLTYIPVTTARQMQQCILQYLPQADALVMTAAVSDWRPACTRRKKIKRKRAWELPLIPNPDILKSVKKRKRPGQLVVGFALETDAPKKHGLRKLKEKGMDLIVVDSPEFFGKENPQSPVLAISATGETVGWQGISKEKLASFIVSFLEQMQPGRKNLLSCLAQAQVKGR